MNYKLDRYITDCPEVRTVPGRRGICYWLQEPLAWIDTDGEIHSIPLGFVSDGYSVPPLLWGIIRGLRSLAPALHHDAQFLTGETRSLMLANRNIYHGVVITDSGRYTAGKLYAGLFLGSWKPWYTYRILQAKHERDWLLNRQIATTLDEAKHIAMEVL